MAAGVGFAIGAVVVALALLLPSGSIAQYLAFAVAGLPGILAWLGFPVWTLLLRSVLNRRIKGARRSKRTVGRSPEVPVTTPRLVSETGFKAGTT